MSRIPHAFFNIYGINFGSLEDDPEKVYAIQIYNPVTNKKSDLFTFHYKNHSKFHQKFSIDIVNLSTQTFTIYLHKINAIFNTQIAEAIVPLSAFAVIVLMVVLPFLRVS